MTPVTRPARDHRTLVRRFGRSERVAHWLLAATFGSMLASGVLMGGIGPLTHHVLLIVHVGSAVVLLAGVAVLIAIRRTRRPLAQAVRDLRPLDESDRRWLAHAPRVYLRGGGLPAGGRFNAGQKVNARLLLLILLVLFISGAGELGRQVAFLRLLGFASFAHGLAAVVAGGLVAGHVYLAILHPATRPAFRGITRGSVDREWAEHHHGRWVTSVDAEGATDGERAERVPSP